ncbi:Spore germination protein [Desulfosporosinus sp. I2]|uniref:GerMN domain-containing protein n=1 Tax=Desulfosporosinus sp. I2 TaxID=1617025 RepID=UPI0005EE8297|nr:GerMN domain-containing protein [Desulfosporosinus sp. I2]KJR49426.1 Spore germination protein [Desulfosporosinus sp. I2]
MYKQPLKSSLILIVCLLLAIAFFMGFHSTQTQSDKPSDISTTPTAPITPTSPATTPSQPTPQSVNLTLYYPNSQATGLIAAKRTVEVTDQEIINAMFRELAVPPVGLEKLLPPGTKLLSASVNTDGMATINLSQEFQKNFGGGSAEEQLTLYSIVNTLTTLPNVHSVQFLLEGQMHPGILGHIDTSEPLKRNERLILKTP